MSKMKVCSEITVAYESLLLELWSCNPDEAVICKGEYPVELKSVPCTEHLLVTSELREMDILKRDLTHSRMSIYLSIYNTRRLEN